MAWINYNGVDSRDLGIIISKMPSMHRAARRYSQYDVPARNSSIVIDDGSYSNFDTSITINCFGKNPNVVYNWLSGSGWMITSDDPSKKRYIYCFDQQTNSRWRECCNTSFDIISIPITCEPFCRLVNEEQITLTGSQYIQHIGDVPAYPTVMFTKSTSTAASATLYVGSDYVSISNCKNNFCIDFENKIFYYQNGTDITTAYSQGTKVTFHSSDTSNRWLHFNKDSSTQVRFSGSNVTKITINPNWRWY